PALRTVSVRLTVPPGRIDAGATVSAVTVRSGAGRNDAVTARSCAIVTTHAPVPVQPPDQPAKSEPAPATAVSGTSVPSAKVAAHAEPHARPPGPTTAPLPAPIRPTVSVRSTTGTPPASTKVAVTSRAALSVTRHALVPVHAPLQPSKREPGAAPAVRVTTL